MGRALTVNVAVVDNLGRPVVLTAGDEVPKWAADQVGDHCFGASLDAGAQAPPRAGKGSGQSEWLTFARENDVAVDDEDGRDSIISKCEAAGLVQPVE